MQQCKKKSHKEAIHFCHNKYPYLLPTCVSCKSRYMKKILILVGHTGAKWMAWSAEGPAGLAVPVSWALSLFHLQAEMQMSDPELKSQPAEYELGWTRVLHFCKYHLFRILNPSSWICQLLSPARQNHTWKLIFISISIQWLISITNSIINLKINLKPCYKTIKRAVV